MQACRFLQALGRHAPPSFTVIRSHVLRFPFSAVASICRVRFFSGVHPKRGSPLSRIWASNFLLLKQLLELQDSRQECFDYIHLEC